MNITVLRSETTDPSYTRMKKQTCCINQEKNRRTRTSFHLTYVSLLMAQRINRETNSQGAAPSLRSRGCNTSNVFQWIPVDLCGEIPGGKRCLLKHVAPAFLMLQPEIYAELNKLSYPRTM
ncbi:hypothetical protein GOODEAATRI_028492 [Goodea atripinnis]|uniref:Uncharacterized protein n=1 Tax=Goodea atripinnis TaxID=208336 RepID=A0ABV0NED8_9TELE